MAPGGGWRRVLGWLAAIAAAAGLSVALPANLAHPGPVERLNPNGKAGAALVAYHPGLGGFTAAVTRAYAEGLAAAGWAVDLVPVSAEAPADGSGYGLITVVSPASWWALPLPVSRYLRRLSGCTGRPAVALVAAARPARRSLGRLSLGLERAGARVMVRRAFLARAPNDEAPAGPGGHRARALELAGALGRSLTPAALGDAPP